MTKRFLQVLIVFAISIVPILMPHQVDARNKRLQMENAAYRYKRESGSNCIGRTCMVEAGILKDELIGNTSWGALHIVNLIAQYGYVAGYYAASFKIKTFNPVTKTYDVTVVSGYFPVAVFPQGGETNEGPGGSNPSPPVVGTVQVRVREITGNLSSCSDVYASTTYINSSINISPQGVPPASQTTNGSNYAAWFVLPGTETVNAVPPANYMLKVACWQGENPTTSGTGLSAAVAASQTVTWDLGYKNGTSWPQVRGGDVYAFDTISSFVPTTANPRKFLLNGTGNTSAVVTYGNTADFDSNTGSTGGSYVSWGNWLAKDQYSRTDYYQLFYRRFGAPTTVNFTNATITQSQATSSATPYYATGDITTSGNWVIGDGQTLIMLINGNLNIGGKIQTTGTGFVAFIVNGNITVAPSVGSAYNSTTPALQGVYITSPNGVFSTGQSTTSGSERFVGKGIFVAGEFQNLRDLSDIGGTNYNNTYAAELYQYDPQLLITMPKAMKDGNIVWQEVAP